MHIFGIYRYNRGNHGKCELVVFLWDIYIHIYIYSRNLEHPQKPSSGPLGDEGWDHDSNMKVVKVVDEITYMPVSYVKAINKGYGLGG